MALKPFLPYFLPSIDPVILEILELYRLRTLSLYFLPNRSRYRRNLGALSLYFCFPIDPEILELYDLRTLSLCSLPNRSRDLRNSRPNAILFLFPNKDSRDRNSLNLWPGRETQGEAESGSNERFPEGRSSDVPHEGMQPGQLPGRRRSQLLHRAAHGDRMEFRNVTFEDIISVAPFGNTMDVVALKGKYLRQVLENSVSDYDLDSDHPRVCSFSTYNVSMPVGSRLIEAHVRCADCRVPHYQPLDEEQVYWVVMSTYMAKGGDNFVNIQEN
ncbi:5'-nucleotidase [Caerostris extrusa]|uniref:5'-nucleotidase n=1 Tax=Caerostris extrusa TaxID=172846 RepID=A0AAV4UUL9_CAEEX|nr:5'-nucleotidase [Caerostris extrusa]